MWSDIYPLRSSGLLDCNPNPNPNPNINPKKGKGKYYDLILYLKCFFKWNMMYETRVGVSVKTVTVLSMRIFSCAVDRMTHKIPLYVEL